MMAGMGFLSYMFDSEYLQRSDINSAAREAANARFYSDLTMDNIDALRAKVIEQREDIRELTVLVGTLVKVLGESGAVDPKVLQYRVEAELEAIAEANQPTERLELCTKCKQRVKAVYTSVTDEGVVCDRCMATG
jgi:hypothetical protein